ncbi:carbohydrate sulfotransferase 4-like [Saccostrea echinata]|uniref:carbohydrate sulfotransferase 4-like n=1 Tax=Saccostrea echinata TaxID=191078 RepID=UPI002A81CDDB|nr:carbohydrate sulfotransferase 4-like [Saccostrea echinata]
MWKITSDNRPNMKKKILTLCQSGLKNSLVNAILENEKENADWKFDLNRANTENKSDAEESIVYSSSLPATRRRNIPLTLIVSMMRSGSTFTGDVFRSLPNSLYLFEPMQYLTQSVGKNEIVYVNGTTRSYNESQLHEIHAEMIINLLLCRFQDVPFHVFKSSHFLYHNHLNQHYSCAQRIKDSVIAMRQQCIPDLIKKCKGANSFTIKLITVRMKAISKVMKLLPEVHVIHLVRDPRPVLLSQINVGQIDKTKIQNESRSHCTILQNDLAETEEDIYRNNFHRQRYEDLAHDPLGQFQSLFELSGLEFSQAVQNRVRSIAMKKGMVNKCQYCSEKGDAMATSLQWRVSSNYSIVHAIQEQCLNIIDKLGYFTVNSTKELKDTKISLTKW